MLVVDSREKWTQAPSSDAHIKSYLENHGIAYVVRKLDVGDYMYEGGKISVDRKQDLDEVCHNLMQKADRSRFWREVRRANEQGIKLVVLCEHGGSVKTIEDVKTWKSRYSRVSGRVLMNEIYRVHIAYGVEFLFCTKRATARKIIEILDNSIEYRALI